MRYIVCNFTEKSFKILFKYRSCLFCFLCLKSNFTYEYNLKRVDICLCELHKYTKKLYFFLVCDLGEIFRFRTCYEKISSSIWFSLRSQIRSCMQFLQSLKNSKNVHANLYFIKHFFPKWKLNYVVCILKYTDKLFTQYKILL